MNPARCIAAWLKWLDTPNTIETHPQPPKWGTHNKPNLAKAIDRALRPD